MTHSRPKIAELLDEGGLHPRRDLGQNFVADPNTVRRIAALAEIGPDDHVIEIGAGLGSLTLALAETGAQVMAIEVDRGLIQQLRTAVAELDNVTVVEGDARDLDWPVLVGDLADWKLVANLPYNIATPLVCDILDTVPAITQLLVMVQREVAERFCATPGSKDSGSKDYGAVSVKVAYWADSRIVGYVPASVFVPRPKVESALALITRRPPPQLDEPALARESPQPGELFDVVRRAFGQRRKMLRRSLAEVATTESFELARIESTRRPETLDLDEWLRLVAAIKVHPASGTAGSDDTPK